MTRRTRRRYGTATTGYALGAASAAALLGHTHPVLILLTGLLAGVLIGGITAYRLTLRHAQ